MDRFHHRGDTRVRTLYSDDTVEDIGELRERMRLTATWKRDPKPIDEEQDGGTRRVSRCPNLDEIEGREVFDPMVDIDAFREEFELQSMLVLNPAEADEAYGPDDRWVSDEDPLFDMDIERPLQE